MRIKGVALGFPLTRHTFLNPLFITCNVISTCPFSGVSWPGGKLAFVIGQSGALAEPSSGKMFQTHYCISRLSCFRATVTSPKILRTVLPRKVCRKHHLAPRSLVASSQPFSLSPGLKYRSFRLCACTRYKLGGASFNFTV